MRILRTFFSWSLSKSPLALISLCCLLLVLISPRSSSLSSLLSSASLKAWFSSLVAINPFYFIGIPPLSALSNRSRTLCTSANGCPLFLLRIWSFFNILKTEQSSIHIHWSNNLFVITLKGRQTLKYSQILGPTRLLLLLFFKPFVLLLFILNI